jgi:acetyl-CoA acyltransferase
VTNVYIAGIAMTALGRWVDKSVKDLTREVVTAALKDAGILLEDVDGAWFSNTRQALMEGQNSIRGQCALGAMGFGGIPIVNIENACASSSTGLYQASASIRAGLCEIGLVVGAEKMIYPDKSREEMFRAFLGGTDIHMLATTRERLRRMGRELVPDKLVSDEGDNADHSFFMDVYSALARLHMQCFGTTQEQIAAAAAKNHFHSTMNPLAQYRNDMSLQAVMADRLISWPLTRSMCAPMSDGAAAAIVCNDEALKRLRSCRAVRVMACRLVAGVDRAPDDYANQAGLRAADLAYEDAGLAPEDMHLAEVHDATSFAEILQIENLRFCARGDGGAVTLRGDTTLGGRIPVNTSGGLVSKGHPIAATGLMQLYELVTQLRGEAGARQVEDAHHAIAENGGGFIGVEEAAAVVTILTRYKPATGKS